MHIPNGFLDPKVSTGAAFAAASVLGYCVSKVRQALSKAVPEALMAGAGNIITNISDGSKKLASNIAEQHFMKMGAIASLIFAAQMFNFPVDKGTSGHLLGGIIAAIALGPFSGTLVIAAVLAVQSIFFGDGGMAALGANILNMAVIGTFCSYYIYYIVSTIIKNRIGHNAGIILASFCSVLFAAVACSLEIAWSGTISLGMILPAMMSVHARIGIAEGLLTIAGIQYLTALKFELEGKITDEK
jgi:cobalt/nickel transport system permease protein